MRVAKAYRLTFWADGAKTTALYSSYEDFHLSLLYIVANNYVSKIECEIVND